MAKKKKVVEKKGLDTKTVVIGVVIILIGLFAWMMFIQKPVGDGEGGLGQMAPGSGMPDGEGAEAPRYVVDTDDGDNPWEGGCLYYYDSDSSCSKESFSYGRPDTCDFHPVGETSWDNVDKLSEGVNKAGNTCAEDKATYNSDYCYRLCNERYKNYDYDYEGKCVQDGVCTVAPGKKENTYKCVCRKKPKLPPSPPLPTYATETADDGNDPGTPGCAFEYQDESCKAPFRADPVLTDSCTGLHDNLVEYTMSKGMCEKATYKIIDCSDWCSSEQGKTGYCVEKSVSCSSGKTELSAKCECFD